jgi:hypothetical protein
MTIAAIPPTERFSAAVTRILPALADFMAQRRVLGRVSIQAHSMASIVPA